MSRTLRIRRWGWGLAAVLAVSGIGWALRPAPLQLDLVAVTRGTVAEEVRGDGRTRVRQLYVVSTPVDGELERIAVRAGDAVEAGQSVARVWPATSRPLDPRAWADARAAVEAAIVVSESKDTLRVPATALFRSGEQWAVYTVERGRARTVTVDIGASDGAWTAVRAGLGEDAIVIVQPADSIRDGTSIAPGPAPSGSAMTNGFSPAR